MAAQLEVEGDTATAAGHDLSELRQELSQHQVLFVADICSAYDAEATLKDLIASRKEDILELIDEINGDANNQHRIPVMKKKKFAKIIANYAERQNIAKLNDGEDDIDGDNAEIDPTKHVTTDREEREAIGKLFHRIKKIGSAILSVSKAVKQVEVLRKECETEIVSMFAVQRESLKQREEQLLTELLAQVAERKTEPNRYRCGKNPGGLGGSVYGDEKLSTLYLGSGGGSGHPYASAGDGECGGNGGGALRIAAQKIVIERNGYMQANGDNAPHVSGGGGGSGGSIYLRCREIENSGTIEATGGKGAIKGNESGYPGICSNGGDGGFGRIRIDSSNAAHSACAHVADGTVFVPR